MSRPGVRRVKIWPARPVADIITAALPGTHLGTVQERHPGAPETAALGHSRRVPVLTLGGIAGCTRGAWEVRWDWSGAGFCLKCFPWTSEFDHKKDILCVTVNFLVAAISVIANNKKRQPEDRRQLLSAPP